MSADDPSQPALIDPGELAAAILESSDDAIVSSDLGSVIRSWNPGAERIFGYSAPEAVGTSVLSFIPEDRRDEEARVLRQVLAGQRVPPFETLRLHRDGRAIPVSVTASAVRDGSGRIVGVARIARDVTSQRQNELEIARLSRLYVALSHVSQAVASMPTRDELFDRVCRVLAGRAGLRMVWIGWTDPETHRLVPVASCGDEHGYLSEVTIYTDDRPEGRGPSGTAVRTERPYVCPDLLADPATLPWREALVHNGFRSLAAFPIRCGGVVLGALNVYAEDPRFFRGEEVALLEEAARDLSVALDNLAREQARRTAEEGRLSSETRYRTLFEHAPDGIVVADQDSTYLDANGSICRMLGYAREELIGLNARDIIVPRQVEHIAGTLEELRARSVHFGEWWFRRKDGSEFPAEVAVTQTPDGHLLGIIRDVTERLKAERELRELNETLEQRVAERTAELEAARVRAEAADRVKSAFLATMSHELRTPLNSIIGFTGIVLQGLAGPLNPEQTKQLGMVRGSARHLLELINDVLDLSKIEAGQMEVRAEPFDLAASLEQVVASVRPLAERKGLALTADLRAAGPPIRSDRRRVEQILLNLLQNAIKFTDRGAVGLTAELVDVSGNGEAGTAVRIRVDDTGIGIAEAELAGLFQPFRQVDHGLARHHEGTGLGLAICRRLASLLGGTVTATSTPGVGSRFTLLLPLHGEA